MTDHELIHTNNLIARFKRLRLSSGVSLAGWVALGYLVCLAAAEILTTHYAPILGLALHGVLFVALLVHASLVSHLRQRRFLLALALVPLIRLLSLSIPLALFPVIYRYAAIGAPLLLAVILAARGAGLDLRMTGLTLRTIPLQILAGLTGLLLGYIEYLILRPAPLVAALRLELIWLPALILLVFTGFLEELIFRGVLQYGALQQLGRFGIPYVAVIFAVLHLGYHSAFDLLFVFGVAILFGWFVWRTGSILGVVLSHGLTNITLYLVLPLLLAQPAGPTAVPANDVSSGNPVPNGIFIAIPVRPTQEPIPTPFQPGASTLPAVWQMLSTLEAADQTSTPATGESANPSSTPVNKQPAADPTEERCSPPAGWVIYTVRPGDTLSAISQVLGISIRELQTANCLKKTSMIFVGQPLYVPHLVPMPTRRSPTATPRPTAVPTEPPTLAPPTLIPPTHAPTQVEPTPVIPTPVPPTPVIPTDSFTPLPPSNTPIPPDTPTPAPTESAAPLSKITRLPRLASIQLEKAM